MPLSATHIQRLVSLNLPGKALREVLSIVAEVQAIGDARENEVMEARRKDRERKRGFHGNSTEIPRNEDGNSTENPWKETGSSTEFPGKKERSPTPPKEKLQTQISTSAREAVRATRVPDDFAPLPNIRELGLNRGLTAEEFDDQIERMKDHFRASSGKNAAKRDWQATARNWIKRAADDKKRLGNRWNKPSAGDKMRDAFDEVRSAIGKRDKGTGGLF